MSVHYFTYCAKCGNESESGGLYCDRCNDKIYGDHSNCVITTAVCEHFGKPDNCEELEVLRKFRDEFMLKTPERKDLVEQYYKLAPQLAKILKNHPKKDAIYQNLLNKYINPSVAAAKEGNYPKTFEIYVSGIKELQQLLDN